MTRRRAGAVFAALLVTACGTGQAPETWPEGSVHGAWQSVFTGYGHTGSRPDGTLVVSPVAPTGADTHAALIAGVAGYGDFDATIRLRTVAQLRVPTPHEWEAGWVLWHYTDPQHFYYVLLKGSGWEIGKEDPAYPGSQRFLATGPGRFTVGDWHEVRVRQTGTTITVWVDGAEPITLRDDERPYPAGRIGLYAEDATAEFQPGTIRALP
ncbi:DUF1080 domain-containing protein [Amycolatopsis sp. K13G38]|uniref:DUF1080 domain-containing protein n=1 Tax=Amycolatopsis acididurans TaxID=2724524 RepID=A0ABX1J2M7_9PSEU|nr:family 16 glycoside hydrolase [Amycolatopsis acididurans]NKQ52531.1 DUF1080 domain-containing protein [Amycolatopsis acididurans]